MRNETTTETATIHAVAYIRVNERAVADAEAVTHRIERQRLRCETLADEHGLTIARAYVDRTGAVPIVQRPELQRMLNELPATRARYVLTAGLERISRSARDIIVIERRLIEVGAELLVWGESDVHAHLRRRMTALFIEHGVGQEDEPV